MRYSNLRLLTLLTTYLLDINTTHTSWVVTGTIFIMGKASNGMVIKSWGKQLQNLISSCYPNFESFHQNL